VRTTNNHQMGRQMKQAQILTNMDFSDVFLACVIAISFNGCVDNGLNSLFKTYPKVQCVGDSSVKK